MKVSALIPAYNCEATIRTTLDSVLAQTRQPDEILVMNDGSTDNTASILESYKPRITIFRQPNKGLAVARNELVARAQGDLLAFLDSDDIWNPQYLEVQHDVFAAHPNAVAFFVGHVNFYGDGDYQWDGISSSTQPNVELISPLDFLKRYNRATGPFGCFSYCCVPRQILCELGGEPFKEQGAEDSYCCSLLALLGRPVVYVPTDLVAYRIRKNSLSHDHSWTFGVWVHVFEILENQYKNEADPKIWRAFRAAFAAKRRAYAKLLMGANKIPEARAQLWRSLGNSYNPASVVKSLGLLVSSYMPKGLQPAWPSSHRELKSPESA